MAWGRPYPLAHPNREENRGWGHTLCQERLREGAEKQGLGSEAHVGDEGPEALHDVGAVVTLEYHVQVHEDPLVLFLVPRASHLLHRMAGEGRRSLAPELRGMGLTRAGWVLTLTAITWPVFRKRIFHTWPQVPLPISPRFSRSLISAW